MATAILATAGLAVASERKVLERLNSPNARQIVVSDPKGSAGLRAETVNSVAALPGVDWAIGLGAARDVSNAAIPGGSRVPARLFMGNLPSQVRVGGRQPLPGEALAGSAAVAVLGLADEVGGVSGDGVSAAVVGTFTALPPLQDLADGVLLVQPINDVPIRTLRLGVSDVQQLQSIAEAVLAVAVVGKPEDLRVDKSAEIAELEQDIGGELRQSSRRLVWLILVAGIVMVAVTQVGAAAQRVRDYGRRRALGSTRSAIVVTVIAQSAVGGLAGAMVGALAGLVVDWLVAGALPGARFAAAVVLLCILAAVVAGVPAALRSAWKDPVRVLRVP